VFGSFYIYSPRGKGPVCEVSRRICIQLKLGDPAWLANYARRVREELTLHDTLAGLFDRETCFVPVPSSTLHSGSAWAAERLATALHGVGIGKGVWPGLYRCHAVRKSATALSGHRPTVRQHYESLSVAHSHQPVLRILLIDDVITRGRTILAAALRLHEAHPNADIRAFALVRTMGLLPDVTHFFEPCQGVIHWAGGDARREP
jgi:predicted amidophosphoribosyltransferase